MSPKTLGTKDVARLLDVSEATVRRYSEAELLPAVRLTPTGPRRFREEDVRRLLKRAGAAA
jgi:DNA-binding transcriptional MerR regulator